MHVYEGCFDLGYECIIKVMFSRKLRISVTSNFNTPTAFFIFSISYLVVWNWKSLHDLVSIFEHWNRRFYL